MNYEGKLTVHESQRFALVVSRFNDIFTSKLLEGAKGALLRHGAQEDNVDVYWVSGAFEIPLILKKLAKSQSYDALVALGVVIKGATPHFDYVCSEVSKGITSVSLDCEIPVGFGVLTTNNMEEAMERSGSKAGNKGYEAALATIEQLNLIKQIQTN